MVSEVQWKKWIFWIFRIFRKLLETPEISTISSILVIFSDQQNTSENNCAVTVHCALTKEKETIQQPRRAEGQSGMTEGASKYIAGGQYIWPEVNLE